MVRTTDRNNFLRWLWEPATWMEWWFSISLFLWFFYMLITTSLNAQEVSRMHKQIRALQGNVTVLAQLIIDHNINNNSTLTGLVGRNDTNGTSL